MLWSLRLMAGPLFGIACWSLLVIIVPGDLTLGRISFETTPAVSLGEYRARIVAMATTVLFVAIAIAASLFSFVTLRSLPHAQQVQRAFLSAWVLLGGAIATILCFTSLGLTDGRVYDLLGRQTFIATLGRIDGGKPLFFLHRITDVGNVGVAFACTGLALTACSIALLIRRCRRKSDLKLLESLAARQDQLLATAATLLVAGTIWTRSWHSWPTPFLTTEQATLHNTVASGVLSYQSVCYVVILMGLYLPLAFLRIHAQRKIVPDQASKDESNGPWGPGVAAGLRTLAMIAPVLAGPFTDLFGTKLFGS